MICNGFGPQFYAARYLHGEFIGACLMENENENKKSNVNWEKIGVYFAITVSIFTMISYLFQMKDEISLLRERIAKLEVKIEK